MTLINCYVTPARGLMLTDTLVTRGEEPAAYITKFDLLPHLGAVLATRGRGLVHRDALDGLNLALPLRRGLEDVPAELPDHLCLWRDHRIGEMEAEGRGPGEWESIAWLLAWDAAEGRIRCWSFYSEDDFEAVERAPGLYLNPDLGQPTPEKVTLDQMLAVTRLQKELMDTQSRLPGQERRGPTIGGEVWATEVSEAGFTCRRVYRFHDRAAVAEGFGGGRAA